LSIDLPKNTQVPYMTNICQVGAELFHADRRTDRRDEADSRFSQSLRTRLKTDTERECLDSPVQDGDVPTCIRWEWKLLV